MNHPIDESLVHRALQVVEQDPLAAALTVRLLAESLRSRAAVACVCCDGPVVSPGSERALRRIAADADLVLYELGVDIEGVRALEERVRAARAAGRTS